jgi:hypothetical protein
MNKAAENVYAKNQNNLRKRGNQSLNTKAAKTGNSHSETRPAPIPLPAPEFWKNSLSYQNKSKGKN